MTARGEKEREFARTATNLQNGAPNATLVCQLHEGRLRTADLPRRLLLMRVVMHVASVCERMCRTPYQSGGG